MSFLKKIKRMFLVEPERGMGRFALISIVDSASLFTSEQLVKVGSDYGGWLLPRKNRLSKNSICYAVGAGEDITFDCELANIYGCKVRIFDPTPKSQAHFHRLLDYAAGKSTENEDQDFVEKYNFPSLVYSSLDFQPYGLAREDRIMKFYLPQDPNHVSCSLVNLQGTTDYFDAQCYRLSTLISINRDPSIELLKMDIEGAEYQVIEDIISSRIRPPMLLIEFDECHSPQDGEARTRVLHHIHLLENVGYRLIAVDGSNATFLYENSL